jgi:N-acetylglutamate synthase-like GNAT family acetyltransferase
MLEYLGYLASAVVLISLLMTSIKKLRWINLIGSILFGVYGFMIGSIPTGLMNFGIVLINIYYLVKIYTSEDYFKVISVSKDEEYLKQFVSFYQKDVERFSSISKDAIEQAKVKLFILRNMNPAGLFVADPMDEKTLEIHLDYVVPAYRDFKVGAYVFEDKRDFFKDSGYQEFVTFSKVDEHINYLKKMGFEKATRDGRDCFVKEI